MLSHEAGAEQEGPVAGGDQGLTGGGQRGGVGGGGAGEVLAEDDDGQQGDDAGHDDRRFDHPGHDEAERQGLVDALDDREDRDGGADAGQGVDEVEEAGPQHLGVVPGAEDVARVVQDRVEEEEAGREAAKVSR